MKLKLFVSTALLLALTTGCVPSLRSAESQSTKVQPTSIVVVATKTSIPLIVTSIASPGYVPDLANWEAAKSCVTFYPSRPNDFQLTGVAVIRSLSSKVLGLSISLLDLENGASKGIPTPNPVDEADVSPDRKTLAYLWFNNATSKWELRLVDAAGNLQKVAWSSNDNFGFGGWLNDYQVVISQDSKYIVVDPFQNTRVKLSPLAFPDFAVYDPLHFFVGFDPLLTRAIYKDGDVIILDLNSKTIIARIKDTYDRSPIIDWQSSGERVAVVATIPTEQKLHWSPDELFIVERNGQVRQLTHLYENFGFASTIDSLSWSPDGEKIAFWLDDGQGSLTLMVADSFTGEATNYCVSNVTIDSFPIDVPAPIWSPDGNQLLVENRYTKDKSDLLVIDLLNKIAFPIAENANPVGWMVNVP